MISIFQANNLNKVDIEILWKSFDIVFLEKTEGQNKDKYVEKGPFFGKYLKVHFGVFRNPLR